MTALDRSPRGSTFPIVEAFGYPHDSEHPAARRAWDEQICPFVGGKCEKKIQYGYGYCSVVYAAEWDNRVPHPYAVCDHRLDGEPVHWAVQDHFGNRPAVVVPEVTVSADPKLNIDYVAYRDEAASEGGADIIAIEAQAIDLRGGGVGPAWRAWEDRNVSDWRAYFTEEAIRKGRRDSVDYGVNTGNVYKRLGTQVAVKGEFFKQINVPLYVVTQHRVLMRLRNRVDFGAVSNGRDWDISFVSFDFDGTIRDSGQFGFTFVEVVRTTLESYQEALISSRSASTTVRSDFIQRARQKAAKSRNGSPEAGAAPLPLWS